jgi:hypothetical protein
MSAAAAATTADEARDLFHRAAKADWPDDRQAENAIGKAISSLGEALYNHASIAAGIPWTVIYPGLDSPDPEAEAKRIADQDLADAAGALQRVFADLGLAGQLTGTEADVSKGRDF